MVTTASVRAAVDALRQQGVEPSVRKVRIQLGGGSHQTILRELRQLREAEEKPQSCRSVFAQMSKTLRGCFMRKISKLTNS